MKITEEELQRRLATMPKMRTAGPDDPIYTGGLRFSSIHRPKPAETDPASSTPRDATPPDGEDTPMTGDDADEIEA